MNIDKAIMFLRKMQNPLVSKAELYGVDPRYGFEAMVFPEPEDYAIEDAINALIKLKEYQQLEADGKLLELPCKVGGKVFANNSCFGILEYIVDEIIIKDSITCQITYRCSAYSEPSEDYPSECLDETELDISDFGKTVFLTREEAKSKLEELKDCDLGDSYELG